VFLSVWQVIVSWADSVHHHGFISTERCSGHLCFVCCNHVHYILALLHTVLPESLSLKLQAVSKKLRGHDTTSDAKGRPVLSDQLAFANIFQLSFLINMFQINNVVSFLDH